MTRWEKYIPGQPARILTPPREDEPLVDEYAWSNAALRPPRGSLVAVLAELDARFPPGPPSRLMQQEALRHPQLFAAARRHGKSAAVVAKFVNIAPPPADTCTGCKREVDPDTCYCGEDREHHTGHGGCPGFVPMGCDCHRAPPSTPDAPAFEIGDIVVHAGTSFLSACVESVAGDRLRLLFKDGSGDGGYRAAHYRPATDTERQSYLASQTPEEPRPFEVGDCVVLHNNPAVLTAKVLRVSGAGAWLRFDDGSEDGEYPSDPEHLRHATPSEQQAYERAQEPKPTECPSCGRVGADSGCGSCAKPNPFAVAYPSFPQHIRIGDETIRCADVERASEDYSADTKTLHLHDGRELTLTRRDMLMFGMGQ